MSSRRTPKPRPPMQAMTSYFGLFWARADNRHSRN
jgi:hypothetical protein